MRQIRRVRSGGGALAEPLARELNDAQRAAATAPDGFNLILAGPGSGKTRVIVYRVAWLIARGVAPVSILLATFTRRAAQEMVARLEHLVGSDARSVWAGTFHHIGNRILRRWAPALGLTPQFTILDDEDQRDLLGLAMEQAELVGSGRMSPRPALVQDLLSFALNTRMPLTEVVAMRQPDYLELVPQIEAAGTYYAQRKRANNCVDYDDLLELWGQLLDRHPEILAEQARMFGHILVDEMQDTNTMQVQLVERIARAGAGNLTAVGDDSQSIYRFRGANYDNIVRFPERNPETQVFHLPLNYRSTRPIVAFTQAALSRHETGFEKTLASARGDGPLPLVIATKDPYEEAEVLCEQVLEGHEQGIALGRMAVIYRNHHDSILLQKELVQRGIPYTVRSGVRFFEQAHVKDVMAHLRLLLNPRDETAWRRVLLLLPGIGPAAAKRVMGRLLEAAAPLEELESAGTMQVVPAKSRGPFAAFVADLRRIRAAKPATDPAAAIAAVLEGGYREVVRTRYDRSESRLADLEQLTMLAARYDSLEALLSELMLAADVYSAERLHAEPPTEFLVLSTIHQAKGLEWSRVFIPRLIEDSFPHPRSVDEPGGLDEERRIFYVGITRAQDELVLTYPLTVQHGGRGPMRFSRSSLFLREIDAELYETGIIELTAAEEADPRVFPTPAKALDPPPPKDGGTPNESKEARAEPSPRGP